MLATELRFTVGDVDPGASLTDTATLTFTIDDLGNIGGGSLTATETLDLTVTDAAPTLVLTDSTGTTGEHNEGPTPYELTIGGFADAGGTTNDPLVSLLIRWGDGTTDSITNPVSIAALNGGGSISVTHVYDDDSAYTPDLAVDAFSQGNALQFTDVGSFADSRTQNLIVNNVAPSVSQAAATSPLIQGDPGQFQVLATDPSVSDTGDLVYSYDWDNDGIFDLVTGALDRHHSGVVHRRPRHRCSRDSLQGR